MANNKVMLYVNTTKPKACAISEKVKQKLEFYGYEITDKNPDIVIGFGGDGTLINFLKANNYKSCAKYIGINCGTLGFLQDFDIDNIDEFIKNIPNYIDVYLNFISLKIKTENDILDFDALNEFYITTQNDKALRMKIFIEDEFLENYMGTALLFCSPTGSTARNLSCGGSIMFQNLEAIQMTPSEATPSRALKCLPKSICLPKETIIKLTPLISENIKIVCDSNNIFEGIVKEIDIKYSENYIIKLTDKKYTLLSKIRKKLI